MQGKWHGHGHKNHEGNKEKGDFTHFGSLPFIRQTHRQSIDRVQDIVQNNLGKCVERMKMRRASNTLMHLTLGMLILPDSHTQAQAVAVFDDLRWEVQNELKYTSLTFAKLSYFTRRNYHSQKNEVSVIYLEPENDHQLEKVKKVEDRLIRRMLEVHIIKEQNLGRIHIRLNKDTGRYELGEFHLTLFRIDQGVP
jgi:cytochrome c biogenesis factor